MFGECKLLWKSNQLLNCGNTEALKFWAVFSKANNVHVLATYRKNYKNRCIDHQYRVTFPTEPK